MRRVEDNELDALRDALCVWRAKLARRLPDPLTHLLAHQTLCHRHNSIVVAASLGLPDLAEVFATKGKP